jgi:transposase-like protein
MKVIIEKHAERTSRAWSCNTAERALLVACGGMYFRGVSTRNVREVLGAMCEGGEVSAMTVSRVAAELDERLSAFRSRRLDHTSWPYLMLDARYEKVRVDGRAVGQAMLVVVGFDADGRREVLDCRVCDSEGEQNWGECFRSLKDRGLSGVTLVVSVVRGAGTCPSNVAKTLERSPAARAARVLPRPAAPEPGCRGHAAAAHGGPCG